MEAAGSRGHIVAGEVADPVAVGGQHHGLILAEFDGVAGVFDECGHVGSHEHLALTHTDHQRGRTTGRHYRARIVGVGEDQREVALQTPQYCQHRCSEITSGIAVRILAGHQVHCHFGVGVAGELHSGRFQLGPQRCEVLDDPVVDDRNPACRVAVRMGVAVGGPAVRGPSGVAQTGGAGQSADTTFGERILEVGQPARTTADCQATVPIDQRDSRRVIAAVFHPAQRVDHDAAGLTSSDVADDSAHRYSG